MERFDQCFVKIMIYHQRRIQQKKGEGDISPKFNSSPLKTAGWKMRLFLGPGNFSGANCETSEFFRGSESENDDVFPLVSQILQAHRCHTDPCGLCIAGTFKTCETNPSHSPHLWSLQ